MDFIIGLLVSLVAAGFSLFYILKRINTMPSLDNESNIDLVPNEPVNTRPVLVPMPVEVPSDTNTIKRPSLEDVALAMRDFEGKPGDPNYVNHNPLNCKFYYGGYLPIYGVVKRSPGGFAIFRDDATGFLYGCNELENKIIHHPTWTLLDMVKDHAPSSDNNDPLHYAQVVAKQVGITIEYSVINLV